MYLDRLSGKLYFESTETLPTTGIPKFTEGCVVEENVGVTDVIFNGEKWLVKSTGKEYGAE